MRGVNFLVRYLVGWLVGWLVREGGFIGNVVRGFTMPGGGGGGGKLVSG